MSLSIMLILSLFSLKIVFAKTQVVIVVSRLIVAYEHVPLGSVQVRRFTRDLKLGTIG